MNRLAQWLCAIALLIGMPCYAQIYDMREMNTEQWKALPKDKTVVLMPGGILEQHGPYLPSYTDGYNNEYDANEIAKAIVARKGWVVLMFPPIPLGVGGANEVGLKSQFPGTVHIHYETLRAVYMDIAMELGEAGLRWIFVIQNHGAPGHNLAIDQASDFFMDTYGGKMVSLGNVVYPPANPPLPSLLSADEQRENGLDVHGGMSETSRILFVRPDLVAPGYKSAGPKSGTSWSELIEIGTKDNWPGYFGSPRLSTSARGAELMRRRVANTSSLVLRVLDGLDPRTLPRASEQAASDPGVKRYSAQSLEHERKIKRKQDEWLKKKGRAFPE